VGDDMPALSLQEMDKAAKFLRGGSAKVACPKAVFYERRLGIGVHCLRCWEAVALVAGS